MAAEYERHPFLLPAEDVARVLGSDLEKGLSSSQVAELQQKYPPNELDVGGAIPWYKIFIKQLLNAMILVRSRQCHAQSHTANIQSGLVLRFSAQFRCRRLR